MEPSKERPILFSAPMVRAILEGRKTQTRRVVKRGQVFRFCPGGDLSREERSRINASLFRWERESPAHPTMDELLAICPYGVAGDRLWVREGIHCDVDDGWVYDADGGTLKWRPEDEDAGIEWLETRPAKRSSYPSIHVPRMFSRLTLEVVSVRVERVRDISESDAIAESFSETFDSAGACHERTTARENFLDLFFNINKRAEPDANPWVWAVEFKRVQGDTLAVFRGGE